jgi:two-component system response regulator PilR (NtrC family)
VSAGRFREDLFYRLNVINIQLPPLRERKEDLPLLITSALRRLVKNGKAPVITPAAMELLLGYGYPGNVRELENILERAVVLGGEVILPEHLPEQIRETTQRVDSSSNPKFETEVIVDEQMSLPINLDELLLATERRYIEAALVQTKGAKKKAAELLGINFRSFRYRLQKLSPETCGADVEGQESRNQGS